MIKVTIGICAKNSEDFIKHAIDSVVVQDFPHNLMEVIFVDDGSEDKTLSVIQSYAARMDMQVKVFHQEWKGLGASRNVVVNNSNGEYIIWVDSDMILPKDFVRRQVEFMDENADVGIGKGRYGMYNSSSLVAYLENVRAVVEFLKSEPRTLSRPLGTGGSIYRVIAIRNVGGFDGNIKGVGEDMDAENRIRNAGWSLQIVPAEFYEMRRENWSALWKEYFWHGSAGPVVSRRIKSSNVLYQMFPPFALIVEFSRSCTAYKLTHRTVVFLLPLHWILKRISWLLGFALGHLKDIGPR
jgi:glycosyltransferase involved in cell wall biosynthesis